MEAGSQCCCLADLGPWLFSAHTSELIMTAEPSCRFAEAPDEVMDGKCVTQRLAHGKHSVNGGHYDDNDNGYYHNRHHKP